MATLLLTSCTADHSGCRARNPKSSKGRLRTGLTTLAIALAGLYVIFSGQRWMLEHSPSAKNQLIVATCAVDVVFGDTMPTDVCAGAGAQNARQNSQ